MNKDPAMMEFLDTVRNHKDDPERELRARAAGALHARREGRRPATPNYTQDDIVQIARAFTGWGYDDNGKPFLRRRRPRLRSRDFPRARPEGHLPDHRRLRRRRPRLHGQRRGRAARSTRHRHHLRAHATPTGKNTVARRIARRLSSTSRTPSPDARDVRSTTWSPTSGFDTNFDIAGAAARDLRARRLLR